MKLFDTKLSKEKKNKRDIFRGTKVERIHYPQPCLSINDKYFRKKENGNRWKLGSTQRKEEHWKW